MKNIISYKAFGAVLLLLALFLQSSTRVLIMGDYYVNTEAYALFCENKEDVELHCNGQCQLMKKLDVEDEKDKNNPIRLVENQHELFIQNDFPAILALGMLESANQKYFVTSDPKTKDRPHFIFRPPSV